MGLDWIPGARPLPGKESEFSEILKRIKTCNEDELNTLNDQLDKISSFVTDVLNIPKVGFDESANDYLKEAYLKEEREETLESWFKKYHGAPVFDLVEPCDGIPKYSNAGLYENVNCTSFRAKFLEQCVEIIGPELLEQAFAIMTADELCRYGNALADKASDYSKANGIDLSSIDWDMIDEDSVIEKLDIVLSASRYCIFWGKHGFYMHAWF